MGAEGFPMSQGHPQAFQSATTSLRTKHPGPGLAHRWLGFSRGCRACAEPPGRALSLAEASTCVYRGLLLTWKGQGSLSGKQQGRRGAPCGSVQEGRRTRLERGAPGSPEGQTWGSLSLGRTGAALKASSCPQPLQTLPVQKICPHWPCGPGGGGCIPLVLIC